MIDPKRSVDAGGGAGLRLRGCSDAGGGMIGLLGAAMTVYAAGCVRRRQRPTGTGVLARSRR